MRDVIDWVGQYFISYGYLLVFAGAYLENTALIGLFLPGGSIILLGALYAAQGYLALPAVIGLAFLGMLLGGCTDYWIGRKGLHRLAVRTRFAARIAAELAKARTFMDKRGAYAIFVSHFIGHLRAFGALTAGTTHYPFKRFALFEAGAALVWCMLYCTIGYLLGENMQNIEYIYSRMGMGLIVVMVVAFAAWSLWKRYSRKPAPVAER